MQDNLKNSARAERSVELSAATVWAALTDLEVLAESVRSSNSESMAEGRVSAGLRARLDNNGFLLAAIGLDPEKRDGNVAKILKRDLGASRWWRRVLWRRPQRRPHLSA